MSDTLPDPADYRALMEGAAVTDPAPADWLKLTGPDRGRFANGLVSCDLRSLAPGDGTYGFFTDPKGKIMADGAFLATDDELWIELPLGLGSAIAAHMSRYVVADQVAIEELPGWEALRVAGPAAAERLGVASGFPEALDDWRGGRLDREEGPILVRGERRLGVDGAVVAGPAPAIAAVAGLLRAADFEGVGQNAVSAVRIERGVPWFDPDFRPESNEGRHVVGSGFFPQETGLEEWGVSYEKGCYLGQEVIARIHFRGKVNRLLRGLAFESESACSSELVWEGEPVGHASSVAHSPRLEKPIGLGIVHRKVPLEAELTAGGTSCRLVELPFGG